MKKSQKGFTIIEVALVLAIGALIFLVVFLAVPALQRNQRNDARKRDVSSVQEAVSDFNANNPTVGIAGSNGDVYKDGKAVRSTGTGKKLGDYLDTLSTNIDKVTVQAYGSSVPGGQNETDASTIYVVYGAKCGDTSDQLNPASKRQSAVIGTTEMSGNKFQRYCQDAS